MAQYKQTVLGGFQEVEDNLATLNVLDRETVAQDQVVKASQLAEQLVLSQYRAGTPTYLTTVTAQTLLLSNERTLVQLLGRPADCQRHIGQGCRRRLGCVPTEHDRRY